MISFFQEVSSKILWTCTMQLGAEVWVREGTERAGTGLNQGAVQLPTHNGGPHSLKGPHESVVWVFSSSQRKVAYKDYKK